MAVVPLVYRGLEITLVHEPRGWTARIPRFGKTMYFVSEDEAIGEAVRLMDAFLLPRVLRQADQAA